MNTRKLHLNPLTAAIAATVCLGFPGAALAHGAAGTATAIQAPEGARAPRQSATHATQGTQASSRHTSKAKEGQKNATQLSVVTVVGVRASQMRAIQLKRNAPNIQDSITAERIGEFPDATITDALQRVPGVQINRTAGVGSSIDVRGLPEVGTQLNGSVFITPNQIDSQQPDFSTLPATLFERVDVIKSPTASMVDTGISGTLDLHTYRPWDLPDGFTYSYSAKGERGSVTDKWGPEVSGLISYNDNGRWGLLLQANFSDTTRNNATEGLDQYGVVLNGENAASADGYYGFLTPWNGAPIPDAIKQLPNGNVDVNGDGKSNGVFMGSQDISLYDTSTQRRRKAISASFQTRLGSMFTLTSDLFITRQDQYSRNHGIQFNSTNWQGATYVPLRSRDTGRPIAGPYGTPKPGWNNMDLFTTQVYKKWPGDVESFSQIEQTNSFVKNFDVVLKFNDGGRFWGSLRGIRDTAKQDYIETDINISDSNGEMWPNNPADAAPPGVFIYPKELGGNRVFNADGIPQNTIPITADFTGKRLKVGLPPELAKHFADANEWTMKTLESEGDYNRHVGLSALRFDGHFDVNDNIKLDFGVRNSIRGASNYGYTIVDPVYAGIGASDPNGCLVRYIGADVVLDSPTGCTARNAQGYFRAGPVSAQQMSKTPAALADNFKEYKNLMGSGITFWAVDPYAMDNPLSYDKSIYPKITTQETPGRTWAVWMKETSGYFQADFNGYIGNMSWSGNVGVRAIRTSLSVTQHLTGKPGAYGTEPADAGTKVTERSYWDILPAVNFSLNLTRKLKLRLAYSKNMMPLNLSQWSGGLTLGYALLERPGKPAIFRVAGGNSAGNPELDPWRSTNYGLSLEYYMNRSSMVSLAFFHIKVQSFIKQGSVINCSLPDEDGVVRHRCVSITEPIQGTGNSIHGMEFDYRQAFTFLPGLLSDTGVTFNVTYAPSDSGQTDLAGNKIPFQDNSKKSGNLILWFQSNKFQARIAYNYRSKRAVSSDVGGIQGMELYEAPQKYLDASVSYKFSRYASVFVQGTNLTNEYQNFYLVWPDQEGHHNFFERMYMIGVRAQF